MGDVRVRAARGAICVDADAPEAVLSATERLLGKMIERNAVATEDLVSAFPAEAARRMGLGGVPLMCGREIPVIGSMPRVVRILMHFHTPRPQADVAHPYLDGAESLRDDLG
jgi:chorismate mutase